MLRNGPGSEKVYREGKLYHVQGELRVRGRRYLVLDQLGHRHRQRVLLDDPGLKQLRIGLILPNDSSTVEHLNVLRRLPHRAQLPQIIDLERQRDTTTIILSWIKGIDLGQYMQRVARGKVVAPSPFESVRLIRGLAHALCQLHRNAQIIHGDLKPPNLIITRKPANLVMIDFGSAWPIEASLVSTEGDGVSPVYAAREVSQGKPLLATHADQFSTSVILYQLLTGEIPFDGLGGQAGRPGYASAFAAGVKPPSKRSEAISLLPTTIRAALDEAVLRGLQLDPKKRFPTTSAWAAALDQLYRSLHDHNVRRFRPQNRWQRFLDFLADIFSKGSES